MSRTRALTNAERNILEARVKRTLRKRRGELLAQLEEPASVRRARLKVADWDRQVSVWRSKLLEELVEIEDTIMCDLIFADSAEHINRAIESIEQMPLQSESEVPTP